VLLELEEQLSNLKKTNSELELRYKEKIARFIEEISEAKKTAEERIKNKDQEARKLEAQVFSTNLAKGRIEEELTMSQSETDSLREEAARFLKELEEANLERINAERLRKYIEKMKEEKGKLEGELSETQTEASRLKADVARFMQELEKSEHQRKAGEERIKVTVEEGLKLQATVREISAKLAQSNAEVVQQASEHLKQRLMMEEELVQTQQASQALLNKVVSLDDQIVRAETEADHLRRILESQQENGQNHHYGLYPSPTFAESVTRTFSDVTESWTGRGSPVEGKMLVLEGSSTGGGPRSSIVTRLREALDLHR
jgi:chromosome segregation ATPase